MMGLFLRLKTGRSVALVELLSRLRDSFEAVCDRDGELQSERVTDVLRGAEIPIQLIEQTSSQFLANVDKQGRNIVTFPEIIEHFGYIFQDFADTNISVSEAFAMFRVRCNNVEVLQSLVNL